jgi:hypothetical protein
MRAQTDEDWEWIVLLNNGAEGWIPPESDSRVRIFRDESDIKKVGYLKRECCKRAIGDILVELDHDDILLPDCLLKVGLAFDLNDDATFVYSNSVNVDIRTNTPVQWPTRYGWRNRPFAWNGLDLVESGSADPDPQSISRIWFAPNHVRSWLKTAYWRVGGHNEDLKISDDHDLMMRTYIDGKMVHIDEPLYVYRIHGENTWLEFAKEIQKTMWSQHNHYIDAIARRWTRDKGLRAIDICSGPNPPEGYEGIDLHHGKLNCNLNDKWQLEDDSVGVIRAFDAIEHLKDPIHTMNEAYRVLAHGGFMLIQVPSTRGEGAWCDPTHVSFWNKRSFRYYTEPKVRSYIEPMATCRFQKIKVEDTTIFGLPYVSAHLVAIKDKKPRFYGEMLWP